MLVSPGTVPAGMQPDTVEATEPEIVYQFPEDGDVLAEAPPVLQMCWKEPVNVKDLDKGGDFRFRLVRPDRVGLGMRIVFQPDGYGVAIYPGSAQTDPPEGEWVWDYRVVDAATGDPLEGSVRFTVQADGDAVILSTPPSCLASGATHQSTRSPGATSGSPTPTPIVIIEEADDDGPDVALLALLTIGAAGAAAALAVIGYLIRGRVGFWLHRPPERSGDEPTDEEHH
jgi:hypothetical protein